MSNPGDENCRAVRPHQRAYICITFWKKITDSFSNMGHYIQTIRGALGGP